MQLNSLLHVGLCVVFASATDASSAVVVFCAWILCSVKHFHTIYSAVKQLYGTALENMNEEWEAIDCVEKF